MKCGETVEVVSEAMERFEKAMDASPGVGEAGARRGLLWEKLIHSSAKMDRSKHDVKFVGQTRKGSN